MMTNDSSNGNNSAFNKVYKGSLIPCQTLQVTTTSFTDTAIITLRNPCGNTIYMAWLAATADAHPPGSAIDVYPGDTHTLKPSQLGSIENRFLLIHNTSSVNEGKYEIEVAG